MNESSGTRALNHELCTPMAAELAVNETRSVTTHGSDEPEASNAIGRRMGCSSQHRARIFFGAGSIGRIGGNVLGLQPLGLGRSQFWFGGSPGAVA